MRRGGSARRGNGGMNPNYLRANLAEKAARHAAAVNLCASQDLGPADEAHFMALWDFLDALRLMGETVSIAWNRLPDGRFHVFALDIGGITAQEPDFVPVCGGPPPAPAESGEGG